MGTIILTIFACVCMRAHANSSECLFLCVCVCVYLRGCGVPLHQITEVERTVDILFSSDHVFDPLLL